MMTDEKKVEQVKDISDPRLTAYLLDELGPADILLVENALNENSDLKKELQHLKETMGRVKAALENEPLESGDESMSSRDVLAIKAEKKTKEEITRNHRPIGIAIAILLLVTVGAGIFFIGNGSVEKERLLSRVDVGSDNDADISVANALLEEKSSVEGKEAAKRENSSLKMMVTPSVTLMQESEEKSLRSEQNKASGGVAGDTSMRGIGGMAGGIFANPASPSIPLQAVAPMRGRERTEQVDRMEYQTLTKQQRDGVTLGITPMSPESPMPPSSDPSPSWKDEGYAPIEEKGFVSPSKEPLSTFSIDVDTASWANIRRHLERGVLPPPNAVRIEEMVNYFKYNDAGPTEDENVPFATHVEVAACPWASEHLLARIALQGKVIPKENRPSLRLVFLIDVSGSMADWNKLPLVQMGLSELVRELKADDQVAMVVYSSDARVHLEPTSGDQTDVLLRAIESLRAGGSTAGAEGIQTAYRTAKKLFDAKASNRVILCTDGDFNVGVTDNDELEQMIAREAKSGIFLSILGFGMGNYKDDRLSRLSNKGNGNYGYIDSAAEAKKLLVDGLTGTLITIAKDVKIQVDFNLNRVAAYRLIGYEDRKLAAQDFNNDKKDAGEIGAGHHVTALYEIVPTGVTIPDSNQVDKSRYASTNKKEQKNDEENVETLADDSKENSLDTNAFGDELMFVKLRYKLPNGDTSSLLTTPVVYHKDQTGKASGDFKFAAAVALFGQILRESEHIGRANFDTILEEVTESSVQNSQHSDRKEFIKLVKKAQSL